MPSGAAPPASKGDWPASWRRGWVYDTETTRMCVYPPGGIFTDVWPAWMIQWPRAVVAEGTLDMARLAYASPELAQRAVLSLFRDADGAERPVRLPARRAEHGGVRWQHLRDVAGLVRAVLQPGAAVQPDAGYGLAGRDLPVPVAVPGVVAGRADRSGRLGRLQVHLGGRRGRHAAPGPRAAGRQRRLGVRAAGRASGDDGALGRGVGAICGGAGPSRRTRRAGAAWRPSTWIGRASSGTRSSGASATGTPATIGSWSRPARRTTGAIDPCRYSALAFTPLLAGIDDHDVRAGLWEELQRYDGPPWTLWASWSYVVLEAARLTGDPATRPGPARPVRGAGGGGDRRAGLRRA